MRKRTASDITLWLALGAILGAVILLSVCSGCATHSMKLCNKTQKHCATKGIESLKAGDIQKAEFWFQWILRLTNAELSTYGSVPDEIDESMLPIVEYRVRNDKTFMMGQLILGAAGGFFGLSPGDMALGGGGAGLLTMLITFALGYLKKRKQVKNAEQKIEDSEKIQYAQAAAIELGAIKNPVLGTIMKDEVKSRALAGTRQDEIVQQAVADLRSDMGARIPMVEIPEDSE